MSIREIIKTNKSTYIVHALTRVEKIAISSNSTLFSRISIVPRQSKNITIKLAFEISLCSIPSVRAQLSSDLIGENEPLLCSKRARFDPSSIKSKSWSPATNERKERFLQLIVNSGYLGRESPR